MKQKRNIILATALIACLFPLRGTGGLHAQDTVRMSWTEENNPVYNKAFRIQAALGEKFIVDYGNGDKEDTLTGLGVGTYDAWVHISHTYNNWLQKQYTITVTSFTEDCEFYWFFCENYKLTNLSISSPTLTTLYCWNSKLSTLDLNCPALNELECRNNLLSTLDISRTTTLRYLYCSGNCLSLSECYRLQKNCPQCDIDFGGQMLPSQEVEVGEAIDFSSQAKFDGVPTVFDIMTMDWQSLPANAYLINNGIILFKDTGTYRVAMSHSTINGGDAHVYAYVHVTFDATLSSLRVSRGVLKPAFNSLIFDYDVKIEYVTNNIVITAKVKDPNTIISGDTGYQKLQYGINVLTITTQNGTSTKTYTITVETELDVGIAVHSSAPLTVQGYEIYNIVGQLLLSYKSLQSLEMLPTGIYIIKKYTNNGIIVNKLVINK